MVDSIPDKQEEFSFNYSKSDSLDGNKYNDLTINLFN